LSGKTIQAIVQAIKIKYSNILFFSDLTMLQRETTYGFKVNIIWCKKSTGNAKVLHSRTKNQEKKV
jgi:hypothetical protein